MTRIALLGAGRMGRPIGARLLTAGHALVVHDRDPRAGAALGEAGAQAATTVGAALAAAEVCLVSLPVPEIVESVVLAPGGALDAAGPGSLLVDLSTGPPELARRMAAAGAARDVAVLDAPVSGGPLGARAGTLAVMVGGEPAAYRRALPILSVVGRTIRHMGAAGAGQTTKLANNLLAAAQMAALAEAVALARAEGLDPRALYEVITNASGDSSVLRQRFPVPGVVPDAPASHAWAALFPVDLLVKDVRLALAAAAEHGLEAPMTERALGPYRAAQERGWGALDYSVIARLTESDG